MMKRLTFLCMLWWSGGFLLADFKAEKLPTQLTLRIVEIQSTNLTLEVRWPQNFAYPLIKICAKTNLYDALWNILEEHISTAGTNSHSYIDEGITNKFSRFYMAEGYVDKIHVQNDSDGDGMPDEWEFSHELDPLLAEGDEGSSGDKDNDGIQNLIEYLSNTDPQNNDVTVPVVTITVPRSNILIIP